MVPTCFAYDFSIRIISKKMIAIWLFFVWSVAQSLLPGNWWCRSYQKLVMSQDLHIGSQEIMPWMKKHSGTMTMRYPGFTSLLLDVYPPVYMASWVLTHTHMGSTLLNLQSALNLNEDHPHHHPQWLLTFSVLLMKPPEKSLSVAVASRPLHCSRRGIRNPSESLRVAQTWNPNRSAVDLLVGVGWCWDVFEIIWGSNTGFQLSTHFAQVLRCVHLVGLSDRKCRQIHPLRPLGMQGLQKKLEMKTIKRSSPGISVGTFRHFSKDPEASRGETFKGSSFRAMQKLPWCSVSFNPQGFTHWVPGKFYPGSTF